MTHRYCTTCGDSRNTCRHTTTALDLDNLRRLVAGWDGRFFHDVVRGDIAFVAADCEAKHCDCEVKHDSDGEQDCSVSVAAVDCGDVDDVGEPLATMLNALPGILADHARLTREVEAERDAHHATCVALARERAEVARLTALVPPQMFRVMGGPAVPWELVAPHEEQARSNHDQSLRRLHERGGLSPRELWAVVHGKRWREAPDEATARAWLETWRTQPTRAAIRKEAAGE